MTCEFTDFYQRSDRDFYVEPGWCVESLIRNQEFLGPIHDPACGSGTIPKTFIKYGFNATGSDLKDRGFGKIGVNFLRSTEIYANIVTNPPYNQSERFIRYALEHVQDRIAILARIAFLNSQGRYKLFTSFPPEQVVVLSRRPSMPPGGRDIIATGGKTDFCWIIWRKHSTVPTVMSWSL